MRVDFAVGMGRNDRMDEIAGLARLADDCGFAHMTLVDEPYLARDVNVMATVAALNTRRIRIGQGVVDPATYHPSALANAAASLSELTGGRAFLGIGAGGPFGKLMKPLPNADLREAVLFVRKFMAGEEAEFKGGKMRSEWIRGPVPLYVAADGPRSLELAGEVADSVYFMGGPPALVKWKVERIYRGAERAGRDPSRLDICVRSYIYVTDSKERAWREAAGFVPFGIRVLENLKKEPAIVELFQRLERESPGILDEMRRFAAAAAEHTRADGYNPWFEKIDAPYARLMTQRIIDCVHMIGTPDEIGERIRALVEAGVTTIATATYTIIDKASMLRAISDRIMPRFRN
jgi:5,10-methylenetetrahydromethanopterin reductase